jgi:hypothetical protein
MENEYPRRNTHMIIKLGISVEGQTEGSFVKSVLQPYLKKFNIELSNPIILGGNVTIPRVCQILKFLTYSNDYVTSLYDFYGFQGKLENESIDDLINRIHNNYIIKNDKNKIIPYIQKYEFESLLFSNIKKLCSTFHNNEKEIQNCILDFEENIQSKPPEEINDSILTAPSKRIEKIYRKYHKTLHGTTITKNIGIEEIRSKCPRFNFWIQKLTNLKKPKPHL